MSSKKLSAGDIVESQCTRCRALMNHTIVAMIGEKVVRVECNTCGGVHNYKEPKPAKAPSSRTAASGKPAAPRTGRRDPGAAEREEWVTLRPGMQRERARAYDMLATYKVKDIVEHPMFGLGIVQRVSPNKVEILFEAGKKLMRCG